MKASVASHLSGDLFVAIPGVSCIATFKDLLQVCKKTEFVLSKLSIWMANCFQKKLKKGKKEITLRLNLREKNDIKKSHVNDARCISKHPFAEPCSVCYRTKAIRHHNRQTHKVNFSKGGIRKRSQMPYVVEGYRLWDKVLYKGQECFVSGRRSSGSFTLKKLDGTRISKGVTFKKLRLLEPAINYLIERM